MDTLRRSIESDQPKKHGHRAPATTRTKARLIMMTVNDNATKWIERLPRRWARNADHGSHGVRAIGAGPYSFGDLAGCARFYCIKGDGDALLGLLLRLQPSQEPSVRTIRKEQCDTHEIADHQ
jgi:hypothetical protein